MIIFKVRYYALCFLLVSLTISCGSTRSIQNLPRKYKSIYIDQFKLTYFRNVLQAGFNHSKAVDSIIRIDRSGFTEPILSQDDYKLLDSIVGIHSKQIVTDSINSIGRVAEGAEGKHVFSFILNKLESKWLSELAKKRYRKSRYRVKYDYEE